VHPSTVPGAHTEGLPRTGADPFRLVLYAVILVLSGMTLRRAGYNLR